MELSEFCGRNIVTVDIDETLHQAATHMRDFCVGCLVVTTDSRPVGFVTDRDIVTKALAESADLSGQRVGAVMSPHLLTVSRGATMQQAMKLMRDHQVRRLLIMDDGLRMCGFVTADDLITKIRERSDEVSSQLGLLAELIKLQTGTPSRHRSHDFTQMA